MPDYSTVFKRYLNYFLTILIIFGIGYGFSSEKSVFAGLILGTVASFLILWSISRSAKKLSEAAKSGKTSLNLGTLPRFIIAALVAWVGLSNPETFHIIGVILGLTTSYIILFIDFLVSLFRKNNTYKER